MALGERLKNFFGDPNVAIDLGTANVRVFARGRGLVCEEPSLLGAHSGDGPARVGDPAGVCASCVRPLRGGAVEDVAAAASLLGPLLRRARRFGLNGPRAIACAPAGATRGEVSALLAAVRLAGVWEVEVVPAPLAAAVGAGLEVCSPYAQMIVDVGAGITEVAVIRSGSLIKTAASRVGCSDMRATVRARVAERSGVILYEQEAERLMRELGSARGVTARGSRRALGIDERRGEEAEVEVSSADVADAIRPVVASITETVRGALVSLDHGAAAEVIETGICLAGGGARLRGMKEVVACETSVDVRVAPDPLRAVIDGAGQMLVVGEMTRLWNRNGRRKSSAPETAR